MKKIAIIVIWLVCLSCQKKSAHEIRQENIEHIKSHHIFAIQMASMLEEDREAGTMAPESMEAFRHRMLSVWRVPDHFLDDESGPLWEWVNDDHLLIRSRETYEIDGETFRIGMDQQNKVEPSHVSWDGNKN